ncbi:MAG: hypothetical protein J5626_06645 [Lachnospiraceae bacterium]|nr:hypothetical protein [Lachnospiraceae bacterium]
MGKRRITRNDKKEKHIGRILGSAVITSVMVLSTPLVALADTYYTEDGSITVHASDLGQTVTQNGNTQNDDAPIISNRNPDTSTSYNVNVSADSGVEANITLENVNICSQQGAVTVSGEGTVNIELEGTNNLTAFGGYAALEKDDSGYLVINDVDNDGTLNADGQVGGAGIGGSSHGQRSTQNITINGGTINANTRENQSSAAGIGGGPNGSASNITINGGTITAVAAADSKAAAIGGGGDGSAENIIINDGTIIAENKDYGAAIGGGQNGNATRIIINKGTVNAKGGYGGAGIGGGNNASASYIEINGGTITATSQSGAAAIGGGSGGSGSNIKITNGDVSATATNLAAGIGGGLRGSGTEITIEGGEVTAVGSGGAGIGGGYNGEGNGITIKKGTVNASVANGQNGAGIGGGTGSAGKNITISGGTVTATGGSGSAGIGGSYGVGDNILITGGNVKATGGSSGAGIGGGSGKAGGNITIDKGDVIAIGGDSGAGIGGGKNAAATDIAISGSAYVSAAGGRGGTYFGGAGAGIGSGGGDDVNSQGIEAIPDISGLYNTGRVNIYAAGTNVSEMGLRGSATPENTTIGSIQDLSLPVYLPTNPGTGTNHVTTSGQGSSVNPEHTNGHNTDASEDYAAFLEKMDVQIETYLKQLSSLIAAGSVSDNKALLLNGIILNTGDYVSFGRGTYVLIDKAVKAGVSITINFTYQGVNYEVVIPANAKISPLSLVNEEGYCGFLNLMKHYGGNVK